eukprot:TRINITY_DN3434_c0_g2_i2.p2 TRINITY_DN3434_c0_g2~~TRINITY_DN3434_c0_g2_i2.p2  ORF type:complete len:130 (+),score=0.44 TRINITY_DN3434_c0_g2_i2:450-839(+)
MGPCTPLEVHIGDTHRRRHYHQNRMNHNKHHMTSSCKEHCKHLRNDRDRTWDLFFLAQYCRCLSIRGLEWTTPHKGTRLQREGENETTCREMRRDDVHSKQEPDGKERDNTKCSLSSSPPFFEDLRSLF